jgi:hypothetical protein
MDYSNLLSRAFNIVWEHKFLILLGILVALGSSGGFSGSGISGNRNFRGPRGEFDFQPPRGDMPEFPEFGRDLGVPVLAGVLVLVLIGIAFVIGIVVWVVSTLARGGLIAGASAVDSGMVTDFGQAFSVAWQRVWTLLGIGIIPAIPTLILLIGGLGMAGVFAVTSGAFGGRAGVYPRGGLFLALGGLTCVAIPFAMALNFVRAFANRACILEGLGVWDAYKRGVAVLLENIGPALILFLLQIAINIGLGIVMVPLTLMALCCILWPILLVIQGAIAAYFSTLWTLAWRRWTAEAAG